MLIFACHIDCQGRVLHDLLLYNITKAGEAPTVLLECEKQYVKEIMQTFQKYRLRRKVVWNANNYLFQS